MTARLATRVDPDDIVMSAYRSFFVRVDDGQFSIAETGDLWRLLVEITMHKLYRQARFQQAQRRSIDREVTADAMELGAESPTPEAAAIAADEIEFVMKRLSPAGRKSLELRLRGCLLAEIAAQSGVNEKTVRRHLEKARKVMSTRMQVDDVPASTINSRATSSTSLTKNMWATSAAGTPEGSLQFNDYVLLEQIGQGATGKVYRARHKQNKAVFAIKYLRKKLQRDRRVVDRIEREARTVQSLKHEGICRIEGWGRTPGDGRFLVMEYLAGGDLQAWVAKSKIAWKVAVGLVTQVAEAVHAAHLQGVVHCDIKPGNVLLRQQATGLDADTRIVLTDFGFAKNLADGFVPAVFGTPSFMAPEQVDVFWGPIGPATDVYGLGALLFTLLSGLPPVTGRDPTDVMARIGSGAAKISLDGVASAPKPLQAICLASLERRQSDRPGSAAQVAEALAALR